MNLYSGGRSFFFGLVIDRGILKTVFFFEKIRLTGPSSSSVERETRFHKIH